MNSPATLDIGPLTWVKTEIDLALGRTEEALAKAGSDPVAAEQFRLARNHLNQAQGAISIVGLDGVTQVANALAELIGGFIQDKPAASAALIDLSRKTLAAIRNYLEELASGEPDQPLKLLPLYQALLKARGVDQVSPGDLFFPDLSMRPPRREHEITPLTAGQMEGLLRQERSRFERGFLKFLRSSDAQTGLTDMRAAIAAIENTQNLPASRAFWWATLALLDALVEKLIPAELGVKQLCGRINTQMRHLLEGSHMVPERQMRDILYYVARAEAGNERVQQVKETYRLASLLPCSATTERSIEPLKPLLREIRDNLATAKDVWNKFCIGQAISLPQFDEQTALLFGRVEKLGHPEYKTLALALRAAVQWLRKDPTRHNEVVSLEVATALLLLENAAENFERTGEEFAAQAKLMAGRLAAMARGEALPALESPLLDEMARHAQERQFTIQVAREVLSNLGQIEQTLDTFFRDTTHHAELTSLDKMLKQTQGALFMLNQERAAAILGDCSVQIAAFAEGQQLPQQEQFEELASKLSALGFFVEALQHGPVADIETMLQPQKHKPAPQFDQAIMLEVAPAGVERVEQAEQEERGEAAPEQPLAVTPPPERLQEKPQTGEWAPTLEPLTFEAKLAAGEQRIAEEIGVPEVAPPAELLISPLMPETLSLAPELPVAAAPTLLEQKAVAPPVAEEIDPELLEIFLEEAQEVLVNVSENLHISHADPHNREVLTTIRRSFHTLKGSGRMVGLKDLGEVAWGIEQVMNRWLQLDQDATAELHLLLADAHALFLRWVGQLQAGDTSAVDAGTLLAFATRLKAGADEEGVAPVATIATPAITEAAPVATMQPEATVIEQAAEELPPEFKIELPVDMLPSEPQEVAAQLVISEEVAADIASPDEFIEAIEAMEVPESVEAAAIDAATEPIEEAEEAEDADTVVVVGDVTLPTRLFDMFLEEAHGYIAMLRRDLGMQHLSTEATPPAESTVRVAHTLAGIASTVGLGVIKNLGHSLENALAHLANTQTAPTSGQTELFITAVTQLHEMMVTVAEHRSPQPHEAMVAALDEITKQTVSGAESLIPFETLAEMEAVDEVAVSPEPAPEVIPPFSSPRIALPLAPIVTPVAEATVAAAASAEPEAIEVESPLPPITEITSSAPFALTATHIPIQAASEPVPEVIEPELDERRSFRPRDEVDEQLLPIFLEESQDLVREISDEVRNWREQPQNQQTFQSLARLLHTLKGSARMTGAMGLGELVHAMESNAEEAVALSAVTPAFLDKFESSFDRVLRLIEELQHGGEIEQPELEPAVFSPTQPAVATPEPQTTAALAPQKGEAAAEQDAALQRASLRVRADLIDRFVNEAGEISIARGRIEGEMRALRQSLLDLTENVIRLRKQVREIEIQAESQMQSRQVQSREIADKFDPLEFDRFTRFQELTRMIAESVNDVGTVQHGLLKNLDAADAALVSQARMNRDLAQALMSVRMVPFNSIGDKLYRIVRQTAKELGKRANLDIRGGKIELDRSVLEKMGAPIEHLLRNAISHGLELVHERLVKAKPEIGEIVLSLTQEGNEVVIELTDDGGGLNFAGIRLRAIEAGLLGQDEQKTEAELTEFIYMPGFSTAKELSEISGRGVGMDVVKNQTLALGGRIETASTPGQGSRFRIYLPLTLAVSQAVLVKSGGKTYAIPSAMVDQVQELKAQGMAAVRSEGAIVWLGTSYPFRKLSHLLGDFHSVPAPRRYTWVMLVRSGPQHIAIEVDDLIGNQEIVVKNIGVQLARVAGITGATVLADGEIVLILNPVALSAHEIKAPLPEATTKSTSAPQVTVSARVTTVMVVDDSLTVRKITSRLLERENYRVVTAKDGVDALEQLLENVPDVMLVDVEMPRMDGFDLTRNVRADARLKHVPIIMITSRTADKHRNYAMEIGVNYYLGKPYQEDDLLEKISICTKDKVAVAA